MPDEDTELAATVYTNSDGILSLEITGGRSDRKPTETAMGAAGERYFTFLNVAVPSGQEIELGDLLADVAPEHFAKVVEPELRKTLSESGSSPSEMQTDVDVCLPMLMPEYAAFVIEKTGLLLSAPSLPHAFQGLPPLHISFAALAAEHLLRTDGVLGPLFSASTPRRSDAGAH